VIVSTATPPGDELLGLPYEALRDFADPPNPNEVKL